MTDRQPVPARRGLAIAAADAVLGLPRQAKRVIMVTADVVAIPAALWAALALKFDTLDPAIDRSVAYFVVAVGFGACRSSRPSAYTARSSVHGTEGDGDGASPA